jgi:hypothetical protein
VTSRIDDPAPAEPYDDALRWIIPSDSNPHESYVVELDSYKGNGECQCKWFECRMRPLLARGLTPEIAVAEGLIKLKADQRVEDALRCKHILDAQKRFACAMVGALSNVRKEHAKAARQKQKEQHAQETLTAPPRNKVA